MADRDCKNCVRNKPEVGCTSWDCEYINRDEAIEAWKERKALVRCKECKYWTNGDDTYGICYRCPNTRQMRYDDFCSYGERRE